MQFTINKKALRDAVARVIQISGAGTQHSPVGVRIEASSTANAEFVTVTGSEYDKISITVRVPAEVEEPGHFIADAKQFKRALTGGKAADTVMILSEGESGALSFSSNGVVLTVAHAEQGPLEVKLADDGGNVLWPSGTLAESLRRVSFAMSTEETRYYLNGIFMEARLLGTVDFIATDGHRMARDRTPLPAGHRNEFEWPENSNARGLIVRALAIHALERACKAEKSAEYPITVHVSSNGIAFHGRDYDLIAKAIDGTFPIMSASSQTLTMKGGPRRHSTWARSALR